MTATPWDNIGKQWRELYEQQAELTKSWAEGQAKLAQTLGGAGSETAASDAGALGDLWRSWMNLGGTVARSLPGLTQAPGQVAGDTLGRLLDPVSLALVGGSQIGETIRRMTEGPRFADFGSTERRVGRVMELWIEMQRAQRAYEAVVAGAWAEASKRFAAEYQELFRAGKTPTEPRAALKLWLDSANRTLLETNRSERFLNAQGDFLRRGMDFLLAERELVEAFVEPAGLPTRTEVDEVHRTVHELKRRVRELEKAANRAAPSPKAARAASSTKGTSS